MSQTLVEIRGLKKTFKGHNGNAIEAVKGVDLDLNKGEIFSLLGPNGAGKTTTISMISGLLEPTGGTVTIGGYSIQKDPMKAKALIGVVPQEIALYPKLTALQNLRFFGEMYGMGGAELNKRIDEVFEFIDLKDRKKDRIDTFSGGMKRRVNIGVGLLHKPQLVYMDEPTVGVDPQSRRKILDTVRDLRDEYGMTVLYTTHLMEESQELSDRVGIIDHGEMIALGTLTELMAKAGEEDRLMLSVATDTPPQNLIARIQAEVEGITKVVIEDTPEGVELVTEVKLTVYAKRGRKALPDIIRLANSENLDVVSVEVREPDLESLFLLLTGRALRE